MENYNLISAEIVADSLNQFGERITTMKLIFPRIILAEFNTHRMFNRNSASSRAIPLHKIVKAVEENPFIPIAWQKEHTGMQGYEYFIDSVEIEGCKKLWLESRNKAIEVALSLNNGEFIGVTKQLCNRLLEPFMYHTVLVTATEWENFFELRCPQYIINVGGANEPEDDVIARSWKDLMKSPYTGDFDTTDVIERLSYNKGAAEIHIMDLAEKMWDAYNESEPKQLQAGEWHIPFEDRIDENKLDRDLSWLDLQDLAENADLEYSIWLNHNKIKISTAMAARTSYTVVGDEKDIDYSKMIELHDNLLKMKHMSPFEHCAQVMDEEDYYSHIKGTVPVKTANSLDEKRTLCIDKKSKVFGWSRNFKGFKQYREIIE